MEPTVQRERHQLLGAGDGLWPILPATHDSHAFLWRNDGTKMQDLNKLIDPTDPLKPYVTLTVRRFHQRSWRYRGRRNR